MSILGLLIALIILCAVIWAVRAILAAFSIGDPIATLIYVAVVLLALVWLLSQVGYVNLGRVSIR